MTFSASPEELEAASNAVYERTRASIRSAASEAKRMRAWSG